MHAHTPLPGALALVLERGMIPEGSTVLCAVSGGADSICLLHALYHLRPKYGFRLAAAHYNHHLRGAESDRDASFTAQFVALCCGPQRLPNGETLPAVPLYSGQGDVAMEARRRGMGIEETARELRYAFLEETAERDALRKEYIESVTGNLRAQLDNTVIQHPNGRRTPLKKKTLS